MSLFRVENAKFSRKNRVIFDNINLSIEAGEILAILGHNGVGKTTFLQCCMGLLELQNGQVFLLDKPIKDYSKREFFSLVSYIPQAKNNLIGLNVLDMVVLGCNPDIRTIPKKEHYQKARESLQKCNIEHLAKRECRNLSGGELQMVIFARAIVNNPALIILDEPEANLDFKNTHNLLMQLLGLKEQGKGIILNTHHPQNAKKLANKILIMESNSSTLGGAELINPAQLGKSFDVEANFFDYLRL